MTLRLLPIVALVAGCGRIGFDPLQNGDAAVGNPDAPGMDTAAAPAAIYLVNSLSGVVADLYTLDPRSGQLTLVGDLGLGINEVVGLIAIDSNRLLATSYDSQLSLITLSPFGVMPLGSIAGRRFVGIDTESANVAYAIDETANQVCKISFLPPNVSDCVNLTSFNTFGGDLARRADGTWFAWSNSQSDLYEIDVLTGAGTLIQPSEPAPAELVGLVFGEDNVLRAISRSTNELIEINPSTGVYTSRKTLCVSCPTGFDLEYGDLALGR